MTSSPAPQNSQSSQSRKTNANADGVVTGVRGLVDRALGRTQRHARTATVAPRTVGVREMAVAAGMTALDFFAALRTERARSYNTSHPPVTCTITIQRSPGDVYEFCRKLSQLPLIMDYLHLVREADAQWSHWVARLPSGTVAWDVKVTEDRPGELIAWRSVKEAAIQVRGRLAFVRTPEGATEVRAELQLGFGGAAPTQELEACFTEPQLQGDLRRLKQLMETGNVVDADDPGIDDALSLDEPARRAPTVERLPSKEVWRFAQPHGRHAAP